MPEITVHSADIAVGGWRCAACSRPAVYELTQRTAAGEPLKRNRATTSCDRHRQLIHDWLLDPSVAGADAAKLAGRTTRATLLAYALLQSRTDTQEES